MYKYMYTYSNWNHYNHSMADGIPVVEIHNRFNWDKVVLPFQMEYKEYMCIYIYFILFSISSVREGKIFVLFFVENRGKNEQL